MKHTRTLYFVLIAVGAALTFGATVVVAFPFLRGYINIGDSIIFVLAALLGPVGAMVGGGVGSAFADLLLGYQIYAPITLVVKGAEGLVAGIFVKYFSGDKLVGRIIAWLIGGAVMVVGYFCAELFMIGLDSGLASAVGTAGLSAVGNVFQVLVCVCIATVFCPQIQRRLVDVSTPPDQPSEEN